MSWLVVGKKKKKKILHLLSETYASYIKCDIQEQENVKTTLARGICGYNLILKFELIVWNRPEMEILKKKKKMHENIGNCMQLSWPKTR